jgi:transposase
MIIPLANMPEIDELRGRLQRSEHENDLLREQLRLLRSQLYGRKSERLSASSEYTQLMLFDEPATAPGKVEEFKGVDVAAHTRKKVGRKPLPENLPRVEIVHDIAEKDKICGCGNAKSRIGEEIMEQLDIMPALIQVLRHIRPKYACRQCEGVEDDGPTVAIAPPPPQIIPKSIVSAGLLAHVLVTKFADAVPFYRQEGQFTRLGVEVSRTVSAY